MPEFRVDQTQRIDSFLREKGYQQYRIELLLRCQGVVLSHRGQITKPTTPDSFVEQDDLVKINDPLPDGCQRAVSNIHRSNFRDYAFAPGTTDLDEVMRAFFENRPQTILIHKIAAFDLATFVKTLRQGSEITNPIRDIIISSHSNPEGIFKMALEDFEVKEITYEDLDSASKAGTIRIPIESVTPRPKDQAGQSIPATLHVRGCRIGLAVPFLRVLKQATGGHLRVTAPKHFHVAANLSDPPGVAEYMAYCFRINRPFPFRNRDEAIRGFAKAKAPNAAPPYSKGFSLINDRSVPPDRWNDWIPRGTIPPRRWNEWNNRTFHLSPKVIIPVTNIEVSARGEFRYQRRELFRKKSFIRPDGQATPPAYTKGWPRSCQGGPGRCEKQKQAFKHALQTENPLFSVNHPFPLYVRYGLASIDEFMDNWFWTFRWEPSNNRLYGQAIRHEYTVAQPIVDSDRRLYVNFCPSRSASRGRLSLGVSMLLEDDSRFFEIVP